MTRPTGLSTLPARLMALDQDRRLRFLGSTGHNGDFAVEIEGRRREYPPQPMLDWVNGLTMALTGSLVPRDRRDADSIAGVRSILVNPSLTDQVQILTRLAMQKLDVGVNELAQQTGVTKKSAIEALRIGAPRAIGMIGVLGMLPGLMPELADVPADTPVEPTPPDGWTEPDQVGVLRLLAFAHEQGVIVWWSPDVNKVMQAANFVVGIGEATTHVHAAAVRPWLTGAADVLASEVADRLYVPPVR